MLVVSRALSELRRNPRFAVLLVVLALFAAAASQAAPSAASTSCSVSSKLVPSCGAWWGVHTKQQSVSSLTSLESKIGRKFDLVYNYHQVGDRLPTSYEAQESQQGRILHVTVAPGRLSWRQVANGAADSSLRAQASGLRALGRPVFYSFDHEPDAKTAYGVSGSGADFVAAWRHVHGLFASAGATNVVWVWIVTGFSGNYSKYPSLYPGNTYVDWLSDDPYAGVNCTTTNNTIAASKSFSDSVAPFYTYVHGGQGAAAGIDPRKPEMLSEYAAAYDAANPSIDAKWYEGVPAGLMSHPDLKAVQLFDGPGGKCNYTIDDKPAVLSGFATAGHNAFVSQAHNY